VSDYSLTPHEQIFPLCHSENKLHFDETMIMSALF